MSRQFDRLFVLWSEPEKGRRIIIGELDRSPAGFRFAYRLEDLARAEQAGFLLPPEFQERRGPSDPYTSAYLFPTFGQRIPSPARPDRKRLLEAWGVEDQDDPMEILARSGGVQITDRLELAEFRSADDDLGEPLCFRLAAELHFPEGSREIEAGESLTLQREPANEYDSQATLVLKRDGRKVGHVPKQYTELVARLLEAGVSLDATAIRRLQLPETRDRWVIRIQRA